MPPDLAHLFLPKVEEEQLGGQVDKPVLLLERQRIFVFLHRHVPDANALVSAQITGKGRGPSVCDSVTGRPSVSDASDARCTYPNTRALPGRAADADTN